MTNQLVAQQRREKSVMKERLVVIACFIGLIIFGILSDTSRYQSDKTEPSAKKGDDNQIYIDRGKAKADKGEYFEAISDYDIAIKLNPSNAKSYHYRGKAKAELGLHAAAIVDYDTSISLDPDATYAYNDRGWEKYRSGQHTDAIADYNMLISLEPDDADLYRRRGWAKPRLGQHFAAIADCNTAIRLDPDNAHAYYYRGLVKNDLVGHHPRGHGWRDLVKALKLAEKMGDRKLHSAIKDAMYP